MIKKILALALAVVMIAVCMTACSSQKVTVESIQKAGKLVIGTSPDFPPFESLAADGSVEGIEVQTYDEVCRVYRILSFLSVLCEYECIVCNCSLDEEAEALLESVIQCDADISRVVLPDEMV